MDGTSAIRQEDFNLLSDFNLLLQRHRIAVLRVNIQRLLAVGQSSGAVVAGQVNPAQHDVRFDQSGVPGNRRVKRLQRIFGFVAMRINDSAQKIPIGICRIHSQQLLQLCHRFGFFVRSNQLANAIQGLLLSDLLRRCVRRLRCLLAGEIRQFAAQSAS